MQALTHIISFNIHNRLMEVDAIIPHLTGAEVEAQRGEETGGAHIAGEQSSSSQRV